MRILAVDDEELALKGMLKLLQAAAPEAQVLGVAFIEDALELAREAPFDIAFLDVEMAEASGIQLARQLQAYNPNINIIFATGYAEYRDAAFDLHASGYLLKPVTGEKIRRELEDLRHPLEKPKRLRVRCFGSFEATVDASPLRFKYERTKELLAYLVDRRGALCTNGQVVAVMFEDDENHDAYLRSLKKDLQDTLSAAGCGGIVLQQRGKLGILADEIQCDYYDWCGGKPVEAPYTGAYMSQYGWAEDTNESLRRFGR